MSLPKPNVSFKIPSIHDDVELECHIHYPRTTERNSSAFGRSFAVFAHPYAPLGGCSDDPVVALAGTVFLEQGFVLITFNFRGASGSAGRTSWTAKPELCDYVSIYGFVLCYIDAIIGSDFREDICCRPPPRLVLGGYSYGSMIASHLPPRKDVVMLLKAAAPDSAASEIKRRAVDLSQDARAYFASHSAPVVAGPPASPDGRRKASTRKPKPAAVLMGGYDSDVTSKRVSRENSRKSIDAERIRQSMDKVRRKMAPQSRSPSSTSVMEEPSAARAECGPIILPDVAYLIVSPILSTVAGFTTMFSKLKFTSKGHDPTFSPGQDFHELTTNPCCCIYGNKDGFTSARKLRKWTEELKERPGSQVMVVEADAGHFWHEADGIVRLKEGIAEYLEALGRQHSHSAQCDIDETEERPVGSGEMKHAE